MNHIAVMISNAGTGSNLQAIIDAIEDKKLNAIISVVISDTDDAYGLTRARQNSIPTVVIDKGTEIISLLNKYDTDIVVLAGWKKIIPEEVIDAFENHIVNIHPGLIPDTKEGVVLNPDNTPALWNRGKFTEKAVQAFLDLKSTFAGSSVHLLTKQFDSGPVLTRCFVSVQPDDTVETLYARLKPAEHRILVEALVKFM